jgi:hypothetical protein
MSALEQRFEISLIEGAVQTEARGAGAGPRSGCLALAAVVVLRAFRDLLRVVIGLAPLAAATPPDFADRDHP